MAQAGYCSECSANVWLGPDGSCVNGHPAASVSNIYDAANAPPPAPVAKRSNTVWIVLAVLGALLLCGLASCALALPVFLTSASSALTKASSNAQAKSCFANQRLVMGAYETYVATENGEVATPSDWDGTMSLLVGPVLDSEPKCPEGGTYSMASDTLGGITVTCSVHGRASDEPTP